MSAEDVDGIEQAKTIDITFIARRSDKACGDGATGGMVRLAAKPAMMTTAALNGIGRCGGDKASHEGAVIGS
mgnify:CR=1 FL=1